MTKRKDRLRALLGGQDGPAALVPEATPTPTPRPVPMREATTQAGTGTTSGAEQPNRSSSAAVRAMGLSLGTLSQEADEARRLRETLAGGERVVEIAPERIEPSPFADRLSKAEADDPDFAALKASISEHGQQVPVLLRPHADADKAARGLYQIAYGHRRVEAARELGRPVRAVVRALDDAQLALAQGKENAERRALSFIERALFARTLLGHGFDRATVQAALAVHKSEMTRLLQVAEAIPHHVARAIGPAPRAGRPRWMALATLLAEDRAGHANQEMAAPEFLAADSDTRFQRLYDRLNASKRGREPAQASKVRRIEDMQGQAIAELARTGRTMRLTIAESAGEGFADYVAARLPDLHAAFISGQKTGMSDEKGGK